MKKEEKQLLSFQSIGRGKWIPNMVILVVFLLASAIYFYPALEGKIVYAVDNVSGIAANHEGDQYKEVDPNGSWWTSSMFSGMPNYQMGGHGDYLVDKILKPLRMFFSWGNRNTFFIFLFYLCAFFILLRSFKVDKWLAMAGAFAIALSSYFFVIIAAQHHGKCYSITWMALVVVGFILTFRKQYGWGALMVMFFTYIGFFQHPQMSYYICMMIGIFFFAELAIAINNKDWKNFSIASAIFFASFAIGMGMGSANIFANQEYAKETMRGGHSDLAKGKDAVNKTEGLDLDYATAWSYGIDETMTFIIPNYMGGASGYNLGKDSDLEKDLKEIGVPATSARKFCGGVPTYWGDKMFTSGPVYMGAIICFLFVLGLLIVSGPYKWALLVATLFSVFLSWGHNMMWLTEFFFNYFPMYNKFRAVESILIVAEITMPILGILALQEWTKTADAIRQKKMLQSMAIAAGITGALCLFVALFGGSIDVMSSYDEQWKADVGQDIYDLILDQRHRMMQADAWRSFVFIILAALVLFIYMKRTGSAGQKTNRARATLTLGVLMTALIVFDMWPVDKRFCNDDCFVSVKERNRAFQILPYEQELLQNDTSYYRVLNFTTNTFNDARTSYYLKSVGGYSAAKLRRYQDLIDEHISKMNWSVLNMLNTKYLIVRGENGQPVARYNNMAMGNAWFVDRVVAVDNANAESDALNKLNLRRTAVYDATYENNQSFVFNAVDTIQGVNDQIELLSYKPNKLVYKTNTIQERMAVFSEIYYPYGWHATIDGIPTNIFRVNYMLRAANVPAGQHEIVFVFDPESIHKGNMLALACLIIMLLTLAGVGIYKIITIRRKKEEV